MSSEWRQAIVDLIQLGLLMSTAYFVVIKILKSIDNYYKEKSVGETKIKEVETLINDITTKLKALTEKVDVINQKIDQNIAHDMNSLKREFDALRSLIMEAFFTGKGPSA